MAELADGGFVRYRLAPKVNAHEAAHDRGIVQRLLHSRVRQVEPLLQKVNPQHPLHSHRRPPAAFSLCTARIRSSSPGSPLSSGATVSLLAVEKENLIRVSLRGLSPRVK